jgi:hypothetical protein
MKIPSPVKTFSLHGKDYTIARLKAKHLVNVESAYPNVGAVQKGLRIAAVLMLESMGAEALSYEELLEYELDELTPLLDALSN